MPAVTLISVVITSARPQHRRGRRKDVQSISWSDDLASPPPRPQDTRHWPASQHWTRCLSFAVNLLWQTGLKHTPCQSSSTGSYQQEWGTSASLSLSLFCPRCFLWWAHCFTKRLQRRGPSRLFRWTSLTENPRGERCQCVKQQSTIYAASLRRDLFSLLQT